MHLHCGEIKSCSYLMFDLLLVNDIIILIHTLPILYRGALLSTEHVPEVIPSRVKCGKLHNSIVSTYAGTGTCTDRGGVYQWCNNVITNTAVTLLYVEALCVVVYHQHF